MSSEIYGTECRLINLEEEKIQVQEWLNRANMNDSCSLYILSSYYQNMQYDIDDLTKLQKYYIQKYLLIELGVLVLSSLGMFISPHLTILLISIASIIVGKHLYYKILIPHKLLKEFRHLFKEMEPFYLEEQKHLDFDKNRATKYPEEYLKLINMISSLDHKDMKIYLTKLQAVVANSNSKNIYFAFKTLTQELNGQNKSNKKTNKRLIIQELFNFMEKQEILGDVLNKTKNLIDEDHTKDKIWLNQELASVCLKVLVKHTDKLPEVYISDLPKFITNIIVAKYPDLLGQEDIIVMGLYRLKAEENYSRKLV